MLKQYKAVALYKLLIALSTVDIPFKKGYAMYQLREELKSAFQYQCECERKLIEEYGAIERVPGTYFCEDPDTNKKFIESFAELANVDIVIKTRLPLPITIDELVDYCGDIPITMEEIQLIKPFLLANQNGSEDL